jgi:hypothetical protein
MRFTPERGNQKVHGSRIVSYAAKQRITALLQDVGICVIARLSVAKVMFQHNLCLWKTAE